MGQKIGPLKNLFGPVFKTVFSCSVLKSSLPKAFSVHQHCSIPTASMAYFERFDDMFDLRLKPKIRRNLLSEYVPNEKQPLTNFLLPFQGGINYLHS